jgi:tetratricopeptide (TPR) repeat protein
MVSAKRVLPHARIAASRHLRMAEAMNLEFALHSIAYFMKDWESSTAVEGLYLRALKGYNEAWGAKHTSTLDTVNNLGILYRDQGRMKEAEEMYVRALRGFEDAWGAKHTSTLDTVNNLGNLYQNQGRMKEAEEMYVRALRGYEDAWGAKHTSTLSTVYNLGILYDKQDISTKAKEMYTRAIKGYTEAEGNHEAKLKYLQKRLSLLSANDNIASSVRGTARRQRPTRSLEYLRVGGADSPT